MLYEDELKYDEARVKFSRGRGKGCCEKLLLCVRSFKIVNSALLVSFRYNI